MLDNVVQYLPHAACLSNLMAGRFSIALREWSEYYCHFKFGVKKSNSVMADLSSSRMQVAFKRTRLSCERPNKTKERTRDHGPRDVVLWVGQNEKLGYSSLNKAGAEDGGSEQSADEVAYQHSICSFLSGHGVRLVLIQFYLVRKSTTPNKRGIIAQL